MSNSKFSVGDALVRASFPREYEGRSILMGKVAIGRFRMERGEDGQPTGRVVPHIWREVRTADGAVKAERTDAEIRSLCKAVWSEMSALVPTTEK